MIQLVPTSEARHIQKAWDRLVAANHIDQLISKTYNDVDKAIGYLLQLPHILVTGYRLHP